MYAATADVGAGVRICLFTRNMRQNDLSIKDDQLNIKFCRIMSTYDHIAAEWEISYAFK